MITEIAEVSERRKASDMIFKLIEKNSHFELPTWLDTLMNCIMQIYKVGGQPPEQFDKLMKEAGDLYRKRWEQKND